MYKHTFYFNETWHLLLGLVYASLIAVETFFFFFFLADHIQKNNNRVLLLCFFWRYFFFILVRLFLSSRRT